MPGLTHPCWIFFDYGQHISSVYAALGERIGVYEKVIIVNYPQSVLRIGKIPSLKERCSRSSRTTLCVHYHPLHFPERLPGWRRIFQWLNLHFLQRELDQLIPPRFQRIVIYDSPIHHRIIGRLREVQKIYYAWDDKTVTVTGKPIPGELAAERHLLPKVDLVFCVSDHLAQRLRQRAPSSTSLSVHVLPNPYNERLFVTVGNRPEPKVLGELPRPRLLVLGHISERIDWAGIQEAAKRRPHWTWIFKGSADSEMPAKIVQILGSKGFYDPPSMPEEIPAWVEHCEAGAVPYRLNSFTLASHPLKAMEYLAMGKPVLSTRVPSLEPYEKGIEWVKEGDGESYAGALDRLEKSLKDHNLKSWRQQIVGGDSLETRVVQFRKIVLDNLESRRPFPSGVSSLIENSL